MKYLDEIERRLDEVLPPADERPGVLHEAMRYAVGTGGKRIRPILCLAAAEAVGGKAEDAVYPACAIELLHNYTLIHDDLPAMDNDEERRGQPTVWKKFGEANAILAGDALLALAYRVAARAPRNVAAIVDVLGEMGVGVVRGQVEDVGSLKLKVKSLTCADEFVYEHKTSDLFIAAAVMGGLAAGASAAEIDALREFALNLGLAFQYEDDLLDGDGICPPDETARRARMTTAAAVSALPRLSGDSSALKDLAERLLSRKR